jgi:hypothetical protein
VQIITSSIEFNTGSTRNGALSTNTHQFTGSVLMSGSLGIGTSSPLSSLDVRGASAINSNYQTIQAFSTDSAGINLGGGISLGGYHTGTSSIAQFGSIWGRKENATSGNYDGYLAFGTNANTIGVTERMRITSLGNVGINITNPGALFPSGVGWTSQPSKARVLVINATDGYGNSGLFLRQTDNSTGLDLWSDNYYGDTYVDSRWDNVAGKTYFRFRTSNTPITTMTLTAAGNVGIGTTSPNIVGFTGPVLTVNGSGNYQGFEVATGGVSRFGIFSQGTIGFVSTRQTGMDIVFEAGAASEKMRISSNGSIGAGGSTTNIYNASDIRLKKNINTITYGLNTVSALNPVKFNWADGFDLIEADKTLLGFIAQEVQEIIPEAVESFGSGVDLNGTVIENTLRVNEKFIIPVLVKAIQELKSENDTLKEILQRNNIQ